MMRRICNRRLLGWPLFALLLAGLACGLCALLPPEPRWVLRGPYGHGAITPDGKMYITRTIADEADAPNWNISGLLLTPDAPVRVGPVQCWDMATGREVWSGLGERGPIWRVGFSRDYQHLAAIAPSTTAAGRSDLRWIDLTTGRERQTVFEYASAAWELSISPNGALLRLEHSVDRGQGVYLYETAALRLVAKVEYPQKSLFDWTWSPDGNALYLYTTDWSVNASLGRIAADGETTIKLKDAGDWLTISPDGKTLVTQTEAHSIQLWDLPTATRRGVVPLIDSGWYAFTPDSRTLLTRMQEFDTLHVWDIDGAKSLAKIRSGCRIALPVLLGPNAVVVQESEDRLTCFQLRPFTKLWRHEGKRLGAIDVSADVGRVIVVSSGEQNGLKVLPHRRFMWSPGIGERLQLLDAGTGTPALDIALDPDALHSVLSRGKHFVLISLYETGDVERGPIREFIEDHLLSLLMSNHHEDRDSATTVRAFDAATGTEVCRMKLADTQIDAEALAPDGRSLILYQATSADGSASVFCYDIPPRRSWRIILGIPLAFGATLLTVRFGWRRIRRGASTSLPTRTKAE